MQQVKAILEHVRKGIGAVSVDGQQVVRMEQSWNQ